MSWQLLQALKSQRVLVALVALNLVLLLSGVVLARGDWSFLYAIAIVGCIILVEVILWRELEAARTRAIPTVLAKVTRFQRSDELRRAAIRDEETGLYKRWYLEMRLREEAARCRRYNHSMAVLTLRAGNVALSTMSLDTWQQVTTETARRAVAAIRNVDLIAALGPLEFAICLVHCDRSGAYRALERISKEIGAECQAGLAIYPDDNVDPAILIELARNRTQDIEPYLLAG